MRLGAESMAPKDPSNHEDRLRSEVLLTLKSELIEAAFNLLHQVAQELAERPSEVPSRLLPRGLSPQHSPEAGESGMTTPSVTLNLRCTPEAYAALRAVAALMPGVQIEEADVATTASVGTAPTANPSLSQASAVSALDWLPQLDHARTGLLPVLSLPPASAART
ncbi:hypothetical protein ACFSC4_03495 [Deinococcus malanensis]|uniref:hypothetical protein n=1 Tax=Deinococcus malanensis TaxID=1706855 RepID=UPI003642092E